MPEQAMGVSTKSYVVALTFEQTETLFLGNFRYRLHSLEDLVELFSDVRYAEPLEHEAELELRRIATLKIGKPTFVLVSVNYNSPLKMVLEGIGNQKVFKAVTTFLRSVIYHEETRQRKAAEGALAWENVQTARLENIDRAIKIAKTLKQSKVDPKTIERLVNLHGEFQYAQPQLKAIEVLEEEKDEEKGSIGGGGSV